MNVFVPGPPYADQVALDRFRDRLLADPMMPREPGRARYDDDAFDAKVALLEAEPVPVVSLTFGPPEEDSPDLPERQLVLRRGRTRVRLST